MKNRFIVILITSAIGVGTALAVFARQGKSRLNYAAYAPMVAGNYTGPGYPTQTAGPASATSTATSTSTATASATSSPSPTATVTPTVSATASPSPSATIAGVSFVNVSAQTGVNADHLPGNACGTTQWASGSAWADVDNDGDLDVFTTNHGGPNHFYRNEGDTDFDLLPNFVDIAPTLGMTDTEIITPSSVFVDYDNDGDQDLYLTHPGSNVLYQNQLVESGSLAYLDVTDSAGAAGWGGRALISAWADYDQDGYLDFYLTRHSCGTETAADQLFHNQGDGTFVDVTHYLCPGGSVPCHQIEQFGMSAGWLDFDNDGDQDLYVANDNVLAVGLGNQLWQNNGSDGNGGWVFSDVSVSSGADIDFGVNSMGLGIGDYNNDGWLDIAVSDLGPAEVLKNEGDETFSLDSGPSGVSAITNGTSWATVFFDFDNDGWLDLYFTRGVIELQRAQDPAALTAVNMFLRNAGDGTFSNFSADSGLSDGGTGRNDSIVDFNFDGFVDVLLNNLDTELRLFMNQEPVLGNTNHWLVITVEGTLSNRDAIGTRLMLTAAGLTQIREISSGPTHGGGDFRAGFFGLGSETGGTLTVRWPDGSTQSIGVVAADYHLHLVEPNAR
jgi:hypothetical protein